MALKLHEAIVEVLSTKPNKTATTQQIADEINNQNLYRKKDGSPVLASQIKLRTTLSNGQYLHLFDFDHHNKLTLKTNE